MQITRLVLTSSKQIRLVLAIYMLFTVITAKNDAPKTEFVIKLILVATNFNI